MRIDFTDLRLFANVADTASITRGAGRSHLAPASGSERLKAMEAALGVALFERGRGGVRPTAAGEALLAHARTVLAQMARLQDDIEPLPPDLWFERIEMIATGRSESTNGDHASSPLSSTEGHCPSKLPRLGRCCW